MYISNKYDHIWVAQLRDGDLKNLAENHRACAGVDLAGILAENRTRLSANLPVANSDGVDVVKTIAVALVDQGVRGPRRIVSVHQRGRCRLLPK